ncbi:SusC/RagA family protein, partial [Dysgonomonas sp. Marseille-P4677]|nr:SusC/RagA family protein [Dysgonomonas sp. Marseille-P4677]
IVNAGDLENKGWEFEIGGDIVRGKDFNYSTTMRFSNNSSKILSLWGNNTYQDRKGMPGPGSPGDAIRLQAGSTIGKFFIWRFAGFDDNGNWLLYDKNNNVIPASQKKIEDKAYVGNSMPKLMISWDHTFTYRQWDLSIYLRSWIDFDVFNTIDMYYGLSNVEEINVLKDAYHKYEHIKGEKELCDYWLKDGTFLKIDAINLGYNLNLKKYTKYLDNARFYLTVRDVATFTKYSGLNPEVDITGLEPGFEMFNSIYPQTRRYTLGVQLSF